LTAPEGQALFLLAGPASGSTPTLRSALRKLVRALPTPMAVEEQRSLTSATVRVEHRFVFALRGQTGRHCEVLD
jgi:hypothetical protein